MLHKNSEVHVHTNSWHYRWIRQLTFESKMPKSECTYWHTLVLSILLAPLIYPTVYIKDSNKWSDGPETIFGRTVMALLLLACTAVILLLLYHLIYPFLLLFSWNVLEADTELSIFLWAVLIVCTVGYLWKNYVPKEIEIKEYAVFSIYENLTTFKRKICRPIKYVNTTEKGNDT